jgi:tetratricopeptide (TPR) repeat protein
MKLCACIVSSETKETIIKDAILSVINEVDNILLIHLIDNTNLTPDNTLQVAKDTAKEKLIIKELNLFGEDGNRLNMAQMRNFGLDKVKELGFDWVLQLDTDERLLFNNINVKKTLETIPLNIPALIVSENTGNYDKPRFFRCSSSYRFKQATHEEYEIDVSTRFPGGVRFHELPKSQEQMNQRLEWDLIGLDNQILLEPDNPRWTYYKGNTLEVLKRYEEAIEWFSKDIDKWEDKGMRAWSYFRISCCYHQLELHDKALDSCLSGIRYRPQFPELSWMAGIQCFILQQPEEAITWCKISTLFSWVSKRENEVNRIGFKEITAYFEGPYNLLADIYKALNKETLMKWAQTKALQATKDKQRFISGK